VKRILRFLALVLFLGTIGYWAAAGANRGWTKTSVPKTIRDEVTGIEGVTYEKRFVPGLDFLMAGVVASLGFVGVTFFFRTKSDGRASNERLPKQ
jgi:hypothetical protein